MKAYTCPFCLQACGRIHKCPETGQTLTFEDTHEDPQHLDEGLRLEEEEKDMEGVKGERM